MSEGNSTITYTPKQIDPQQIYGQWRPIEAMLRGKSWRCRCVCGKERKLFRWQLLGSDPYSCGCVPKPTLSKTVAPGDDYHRWVLVEFLPKPSRWRCRCACGTVGEVSTEQMNRGRRKSCGCHRKLTPEGMEYADRKVWLSMINRCTSEKCKYYKNYGGRGITICNRWLNSYDNFLADMGRRPSEKYSLDRVDNDKGYSPENCRWATKKEQSRNRRVNHLITHNGRTQTIAAWAEELGVPDTTLHSRLKKRGTIV
jgi:hypothetical protein